MSQPLQLTSCFLPGRRHHTVRHGGHGTFHATDCPSELQSDWLYCVSFESSCVSACISILTFSRRLFCSHVAAHENYFIPGGMVSIYRSSGGFCGALSSPPDLTPFTLDKHNTKEKLRFYVRRVGYYTQGNGPIPPGVRPLVNHQAMKVSSPNRGLKQTEQGAPRPSLVPIPHWLLPLTDRNFYEETGDAAKRGCARAKRHRLRHPSLAANQS